jgi:hypothetical protein
MDVDMVKPNPYCASVGAVGMVKERARGKPGYPLTSFILLTHTPVTSYLG